MACWNPASVVAPLSEFPGVAKPPSPQEESHWGCGARIAVHPYFLAAGRGRVVRLARQWARVESSSGLGERLLLLSLAGSQTDGRTKVWEARRRLLGVSLCFLRSVSIRRPFGRSPCRSSRSSRRTEATQSQSTAIKCSMIYGPSVDSGTCPLQ